MKNNIKIGLLALSIGFGLFGADCGIRTYCECDNPFPWVSPQAEAYLIGIKLETGEKLWKRSLQTFSAKKTADENLKDCFEGINHLGICRY